MNLLFSAVFLACALLGTVASILVLIGLKKNQKKFLVPFVITMMSDILVEIVHFLTINVFGNVNFNPITGVLFTADFFIMSLNASFIIIE